MNKNERTNINIILPKEVHTMFKSRCAIKGRSMSAVLYSLILNWLDEV